MTQYRDLDAFLQSFDDFEEEPKPIDAWKTLIYTLDGLPIANDLTPLKGGPLHQWFEDVANTVDPLDLVETLDRELRRRVGLKAATSQSAERLLIALCKQLEVCAWSRNRTTHQRRR
ncbi:MAG: hypothetical protein QNJ62_11775 [Methyloceanibacter sp.]|nr:hypothetical protein [Methyloceanibacter sp.]